MKVTPAFLIALASQAPPLGAQEQAHVDHAVVVHADNAGQDLTSERLRRILRAEIQEWPSDLRIELLLRG